MKLKFFKLDFREFVRVNNDLNSFCFEILFCDRFCAEFCACLVLYASAERDLFLTGKINISFSNIILLYKILLIVEH